jgi:mannan endo-1,4-beta-mannosidase
MNGRWFWWGGRAREDYVAMWRHMHDYFSREKGLNNLIWVYESDSSVHAMIPSDYYYPGDDVVDVMSHNFYSDTWDLPYDAEYVYRRYPKVYAFPQAGSETVRDGSWDNMTYVRMIQARYPRASFFAAWNSFNGVPKPGTRTKGLGPNRAEVVCAIVGDRNARELMNHPWIVTRDELAWRAKSPE